MSISKLNRLPKHTFKLEIALPWSEVQTHFQEAIKNAAKKITLPGFRQGKAPLELIEKNIDEKKIFEELVRKLFPEAYQDAIKKHALKPIILPQVQALSLNKGNDWLFKATACEAPTVSLGHYQEEIRGHFAKDKIWTPAKGSKQPKKPDDTKKLDEIFEILLKTCKLEIPSLLVEDEVTRMFSRLIDKTEKLGLTLEQYLSSTGKTTESLRQEYQKKAEETLKLEFILNSIANEQNLQAEDKEIEAFIKAAPDQKTKEALNLPAQKLYLSSILRKRKAIDFLLAL